MAAIALIAARALPAMKPSGRSVDAASIALYAAAAVCAVVAAEIARTASLTALAIAGVWLCCSVWLAIRERRSARPLVPLDLLARRPFRAAVTASVFLFTAQSAGLLALSFHLQLTLGRGAATAGFVLAAWPVAVAASSRVADRLASHFQSGSLCAAGAILLAAGLSASAGWPIDGPIAALAASSLLCGVGFGLFQVPNNRTLFLDAPAGRSAAAGGLQGTARLAGQTAGALLVASILSVAPMTHAPRLALAAAAAAALAAAWVSARRAGAPKLQATYGAV
jgi:DHA2 family multidrug resistance protein-like MFS transporter